MEEAPLPVKENEQGIGPMAAAVIVVILFALGGLYFLWQENERIHTPPIEESLNA